MPRANRHRLPGYVWHLTERCHRRQFLLKFARDRRAWVRWLYEARRRFGLCVLDYQVTCNHVHLLVRDRGGDAIARSMQLIAGATGRADNRRKRRRGAFWEDCTHATAVDTNEYLTRCLAYIDLNMVRAGAVTHPREWHEALSELLGVAEQRLAVVQNDWVEAQLGRGARERERQWSEAVAVGRRAFVERIQKDLGARARSRCIEERDGVSVLREAEEAYVPRFGAKMAALSVPAILASAET